MGEGNEFSSRLSAVQRSLYLLFNEGYHGASAETAVRTELCREAMRLMAVLLEHPLGKTPSTYALAALMCLDGARLPGRLDSSGNLITLFDQDRSQWDQELLAQGLQLLDQSASGPELTGYHVEAAIASVHVRSQSFDDTDWKTIVSLYDTLMAIRPSPIVALNRAIAIAQNEGPERGLEEIRAIENLDRLSHYPFYAAAMGELEKRRENNEIARQHFQTALTLARNPMERQFLERRITACDS